LAEKLHTHPFALELDNHALCILQLHSAGATNQGTADANGAIDALKIAQFIQVGSAPCQSNN
jgi:hypothetical protein